MAAIGAVTLDYTRCLLVSKQPEQSTDDDEPEVKITTAGIVGIVILSVGMLAICCLTWCVCACLGTASFGTYTRFIRTNFLQEQTQFFGKKTISFPKVVSKYVKGGDLIFMEDLQYFDEYTKMNAQTLHFLKITLRLKSDIMDFGVIQQWCKVGIILDTDIEDIKYILELTEDGFVKTEFI